MAAERVGEAMAEVFDPYLQWLGIHDPQRPPNLYLLTGSALFEPDLIAIANAADRQMEQLRYHQAGPHAVEAQRLLQEVIAAKLCLLDPKRKADYDAWLHTQRNTASTMSTAAPPVNYQDLGYAAGYPEMQRSMPAAASTVTVPPVVKIVIGALSGAILLLVVLIVWMVINRTPPAVEPTPPVAMATKPTRPAQSAKPPSASTGSSSRSATLRPEMPSAPVSTSAAPAAVQPEEPAMVETPAPVETASPSAEPLPPPVASARSAAESFQAVRTALANRDLIAAGEQLALAASQVSAAELMELNRLREISESLSVFWRAARSAMAELKPGDVLEVKGRKLTVSRATTEELVVSGGRQELRFTIAELPAALALLLAERKLADPSASLVAKAAFLTFDPHGDKRLARQLCDQAGQQGLPVAALLAELGAEPAAPPVAEKTSEKPSKTAARGPAKTPSKLALPEPAEQAAALAEVRKIHRNDFDKAQDPAKKKALAEVLLKEALETPDEPVIRYVLLGQARDLAVSAGDPELLRKVLETTAKHYDVDAQEQLIRTLTDVAESRIGTGNKKELARGALDLADEFIAANDYESALRLARAAQSMALGRDTAMTKQAIELVKSLPRLKQERERFLQAEKVLADDPNNAAANLVQGQYYCFVQNTDETWTKGLPMLAKGSDGKLKTLAEAELALARSKSKQEAGELFNLAEQWYETARTVEENVRESYRGRAAYWYKKALPKLQGFKEKKAKLRLEELKGK